MTVKFVNDAYLYNTKGELGDESRFRPGDTVSVTSLRYIWVPEDKKAELFYEVLDSPSSVLNCNFVKVSTAKYIFGRHLKPVAGIENKTLKFEGLILFNSKMQWVYFTYMPISFSTTSVILFT